MKITLQETLNRLGKSQYWLSKQTGISTAAINNLCNGKTSRIDFSVLQKICEVLGCHASDIIASDNEDNEIENILREPQQELLDLAVKDFNFFDKIISIEQQDLSDEYYQKFRDRMISYFEAIRKCAEIKSKKEDDHK